MNYTDTDGNPATGIVWSPGPLPGTVWVLPEAGASSSRAVVVHVRRRVQISPRAVDKHIRDARATIKDAHGFVHRTWDMGGTSDLIYRAAHRQAFNDGRGMPAKDWHAALGFVPADSVRAAESAAVPMLFDAAS